MEKMRYCRALYQVISDVNSHLEPLGVLQAIVERTVAAMGVRACSIMLLSPGRRELRHSVSSGLSSAYVRKGSLDLDQTIPEVLAGRSMPVVDAGSDPRIQYRVEALREGIASMLSVPIRLRGDVIGVMRVYTSEQRIFGAEETEFLEGVASLGAVALDNARRYTAMQTDLRSLEAYIYRYAGT